MSARPKDAKRSAPEEGGWTEGTVAELLDLTPGEAALVEFRVALARKIRAARREQRWTQKKLAQRLGSTQAKVSDLEHGIGSMDKMLRALMLLGGEAAQTYEVDSGPAARRISLQILSGGGSPDTSKRTPARKLARKAQDKNSSAIKRAARKKAAG